MGAVRRGYARRFGTAADTCCALRRCKFAALTLFVAPILPARSIRCSRHVPQLGVLLRPLARYPSWVSCCVFWPDDGRPLHSAHCVRNRVPPIRFDSIPQFAASVLYSGTSLIPPLLTLLSAGCKFGFCCNANVAPRGPRVALLGMREITVNFYSFPSPFLGFFHLLFVLAPGLLRVYCWCLLEQFALA